LTGWKTLLFWIPTMCDLTATTVSCYAKWKHGCFWRSN
jgi:hypothetical protein